MYQESLLHRSKANLVLSNFYEGNALKKKTKRSVKKTVETRSKVSKTSVTKKKGKSSKAGKQEAKSLPKKNVSKDNSGSVQAPHFDLQNHKANLNTNVEVPHEMDIDQSFETNSRPPTS